MHQRETGSAAADVFTVSCWSSCISVGNWCVVALPMATEYMEIGVL
jgi:hypothetical protein